MTVVIITTARVVVTTAPLSLKAGYPSTYPDGILRTNPNAMAPLIIPPKATKVSSLKLTSAAFPFFLHKVANP